MSLIRYIHLNPVKAKIIDFEKLNKYRWTGHKEIMANVAEEIIKRKEVLGNFGLRQQQARRKYEEFIREGLEIKEDYDGGGLIRSAGGIAELIKRRFDENEMYDERILGDGDFVEQVHKQLD
jgi:hypothetical protein